MYNIMLQASVLGGVGSDLSTYMPYIQGLSYAIVSILTVVGAFYVANAYQEGDPEARQKAIRLVGACMFFVAAVTFMPQMFGVDGTSADELAQGGGNSSSSRVFDGIIDRFRPDGQEISLGERIYTIELPGGGSAIIHPPVRRRVIQTS